MSSIRSFASPQMAAHPGDARQRAGGQALALALALLLTVLVVEAVVIGNAAHSVSEIGSLYASTT